MKANLLSILMTILVAIALNLVFGGCNEEKDSKKNSAGDTTETQENNETQESADAEGDKDKKDDGETEESEEESTEEEETTEEESEEESTETVSSAQYKPSIEYLSDLVIWSEDQAATPVAHYRIDDVVETKLQMGIKITSPGCGAYSVRHYIASGVAYGLLSLTDAKAGFCEGKLLIKAHDTDIETELPFKIAVQESDAAPELNFFHSLKNQGDILGYLQLQNIEALQAGNLDISGNCEIALSPISHADDKSNLFTVTKLKQLEGQGCAMQVKSSADESFLLEF